jgi:Zn-dependent peptidase ImmA (M78 family)/transcriptional regulator with XRE-family HTH domain
MTLREQMGRKLREAREAISLSQEAVAEQLNMVRQTLARIEKGEVPADSEQLLHLAALYQRPVTWFYDRQAENTLMLALRADTPELLTTSLRAAMLNRFQALGELERAAGFHSGHSLPPAEALTRGDEQEIRRAQEVAASERLRLGLGDTGPVGDPVAVLEGVGIRVIPFELAPGADSKLSGFSAYGDQSGAGIFINVHPDLSQEHQRFSLFHEYAHLVFHRQVYRQPGDSYKTRGKSVSPEEKIANAFAGSFLVPGAALRRLAGGVRSFTITDILYFKEIFRVSATTLITRLDQEDMLRPDNKRKLWAAANALGWMKQEPQPLSGNLHCNRRVLMLSRHAFEREEASVGFLQDVLNLSRKELSDLLREWEKEARTDALH